MIEWLKESPANMLSLVTIFISVLSIGITIGLSWHQTHISKKQSLFDKKLKCYSIFNELMNNCNIINSYDDFKFLDSITGVQKLLLELTWTKSLSRLSIFIKNLYTEIDFQKVTEIFEEYDMYTNEFSLIFPKDISKSLFDFINIYFDLLGKCFTVHDNFVKEGMKHLDFNGKYIYEDFSVDYKQKEEANLKDIKENCGNLLKMYNEFKKINFDNKIKNNIKL